MILVTGCAGFIGAKVSEKLLRMGKELIGVDDMNDYYDVSLKKWRLKNLKEFRNFRFSRIDITDYSALQKIFAKNDIEIVYHLAARAGVRPSIKDPQIYFMVNVGGTVNLLELSVKHKINKFIFSSSSSVYAGAVMPFKEEAELNKPLSPYAASKRSAELICYTYHHLYNLNTIILRYFTVYGPAGRPDMSPFRFIKFISEGREVPVYGNGSQMRDFTYIDDIAEGTIRAGNLTGFEIINLGNNHPHKLTELIVTIEKYLGKKAKVKHYPFESADMKSTWADITKAKRMIRWKPLTSLEEGIKRTVDWFRDNEKLVSGIKI